MKLMKLADLTHGDSHILKGIVPGDYLTQGGLGFKGPGHRSHDVGCDCKACDGTGRHVHVDDNEVFVILQGRAHIEIDGESHMLQAGDVVVCEPGEDHHLVSDQNDPCVNLYLHAGDTRNPNQRVVT